MYQYKVIYSDEYLAHHGILGMKWGVRRYQNEDGSLTPAGEKHYNSHDKKNKHVVKNKIGNVGDAIRAIDGMSSKQQDAMEYKYSTLSMTDREIVDRGMGLIYGGDPYREYTDQDLKDVRRAMELLSISESEIPEELKGEIEANDSILSDSESKKVIKKHYKTKVSQIKETGNQNFFKKLGNVIKKKLTDIFS